MSSAPPRKRRARKRMREYLVDSGIKRSRWTRRLNLERACSAPRPGDRCWLSGELPAWNRAMHRLAFELVELHPGKLRLQSTRHGGKGFERGQVAAARDTAFLISWLLEHHRCIDELGVCFKFLPSYLIGMGSHFPIRLTSPAASDLSRSVRWLEVKQPRSSSRSQRTYNCVLQGLDAVRDLEEAHIYCQEIGSAFGAELEAMLRSNSSTVKTVTIAGAMWHPGVMRALECLVNCESLSIRSFLDQDHPSCIDSVAELLQKSTALKTLDVSPVGEQAQIIAIAGALVINTSLTKLDVATNGWRRCPLSLFAALEANTTLRELRIAGCYISARCGKALASALQNNSPLQQLDLENTEIDDAAVMALRNALLVNTTLRFFSLRSGLLPMDVLLPLCMVLTTNKTLEKLSLYFHASKQERARLASHLEQGECYSRLKLSWDEADMKCLTAGVSVSLYPEYLSLASIQDLSEGSLQLLSAALTTSKCVRALSVRISGDPSAKTDALCEVLRAAQYIRLFKVSFRRGSGGIFQQVAHAMAVNTSVTTMVAHIYRNNCFETASALSYLLAHNTKIEHFSLDCKKRLGREYVKLLSPTLWQNRLIVSFDITPSLTCDDVSFRVFEAVRRNRAALNRAVEFVVSYNSARRCAEAFELFSDRSCLLNRLSGVITDEADAKALVISAKRFLQDNYLIITGVVQCAVQCHPAGATQIDALNADCWRAIVRHLKTSDVSLDHPLVNSATRLWT